MKRLFVYLAVTFGISWGVWIPLGIVLGTFKTGVESSMIMVAAVAAGMFFPLIGALVANASVPKEERIDLCVKPLIKQNAKSYLLAWFSPALFTLAGAALFFLLFPYLFDPTAAQVAQMAEAAGADASAVPAMLAAIILAALTIAPPVNSVFAFGEEAGWRGMLFPTLCELMSERKAVLVSGAIWGLWHAPIIAMGHNYGMDYVGFPLVGILTMVVACTSLGCLLSWLRLHTGSVWPCALAHGSVNAIGNVGLYFCTTGVSLYGPSLLGLVAGIPLFVVAVVCWLHLSAE